MARAKTTTTTTCCRPHADCGTRGDAWRCEAWRRGEGAGALLESDGVGDERGSPRPETPTQAGAGGLNGQQAQAAAQLVGQGRRRGWRRRIGRCVPGVGDPLGVGNQGTVAGGVGVPSGRQGGSLVGAGGAVGKNGKAVATVPARW